MIELVEARDPNLRAQVQRAIPALPFDDEAAVRLARRGLGDPAAQVRLATIDSLMQRSNIGRAMLHDLVSTLVTDRDELVRFKCGHALYAVGPCPPECIPELVRALGHRDDEVKRAAADALATAGTNAVSAAHALVKLAKSEHPGVSGSAAGALIAIMGEKFWLDQVESQ